MLARCLLLAMLLSLSGCWSLLVHLGGDRCIYPGTRMGWGLANEPTPLARWPFLVDVPFSLALDTLLLPYDLTAFLPDGMGGDSSECNFGGSLNVIQ